MIWFQLQLINVSGVFPEFMVCINCNENLKRKDHVFYSNRAQPIPEYLTQRYQSQYIAPMIFQSISNSYMKQNNKEDFLGTHLYEGIQWSWTMPVIYTKEKQSLMMLKLATSVKHKDIIKAITIKEIEENGQAYSKEVD